MKRRFIEYDLPLAEISEESAREKNIRHGHPSTLHIWWARRPLAASRATAFAALIDDPGPENPGKRKEIFELIKQITPWSSVKDGHSDPIMKAQRYIYKQYSDFPPKVIDPFAGGGSIPLEALRLGCEIYASDYNPVAVLIEKATLEWPQKFGIEVIIPEELIPLKSEQESLFSNTVAKVNLLGFMVDRWARIILERVRQDIGQFFPLKALEEHMHDIDINDHRGWIPVGYIWSRSITCQNPSCGAETPIIRQFWLANKKTKKIAYRPIINRKNKDVDYEILEGEELQIALEKGFNPSKGNVSNANVECLICGQVIQAERVRQLFRKKRGKDRILITVLHHQKKSGKKYELAGKDDIEAYSKAKKYLTRKLSSNKTLLDPLPDEGISTYELSRVAPPLYGFRKWRDLFNHRQRLVLMTLLDEMALCYGDISKECDRVIDMNKLSGQLDKDELARAIKGYLGLILDRTVDYNANMTSWENTREGVDHVFSRQAIPMKWDYFEANIFSGATGDWISQLRWVLQYIEKNSWKSRSYCRVRQESAINLSFPDNSIDIVLTDPPYYDNVPYAALSDFFYVWLKRSVGEYFPVLFSTPLVPKVEEIVHDRPHSNSDSKKSKEFFEQELAKSFKEIFRVLKTEGIAVIIYAHKTTEGWEAMLNALVEAGLTVTSSWPIHTEMGTRLTAAQHASLSSSIYMVCRKLTRRKLGFWNDIKPRIKTIVEEKLKQFWSAGIAGGDFFISAIGPGMETFSIYEQVETYDGCRVDVHDLLEYIRSVATEYLINKLLKDASTESIDKEAQFYLTYRWTYLDNTVPFDDALKIARAEGVDIGRLWDEDGFVKKSGASISLLGPKERIKIESIEHMVDAMHCACQLWEKGSKEELNTFLSESGYGASGAFWQFCQAVAECLMSGNKEKQLLEGLLLGKDQYQKVAAEEKSSQMKMDLE